MATSTVTDFFKLIVTTYSASLMLGVLLSTFTFWRALLWGQYSVRFLSTCLCRERKNALPRVYLFAMIWSGQTLLSSWPGWTTWLTLPSHISCRFVFLLCLLIYYLNIYINLYVFFIVLSCAFFHCLLFNVVVYPRVHRQSWWTGEGQDWSSEPSEG